MPEHAEEPIAPRRIATALVLYSAAASSIGSALVARTFPFAKDAPFLRLLLWLAPTYFLWAALVPVIGRLARLRQPVLLITIIAPLIVTAMAAFNVYWTHFMHPDALFVSIRGLRFGARFSLRWPIDLLIYSFIAAAVFAHQWMLRAANAQAARARAEQQLVAARLHVLKSRLQPHFLFNALHTVNALIASDPVRAGRIIENLSELLRLTLNRRDEQLTTVSKEMDVVRLYLAIQKERLGDRLTVSESIDDDALDCVVPDLLLQPIVENAVVHGVAPLRRGGNVSIEIRCAGDRLLLSVIDDGAGMPDDVQEGIGLGATRERLRQMFEDNHHLSVADRQGGGTRVTVDLPMRTSVT